MGSFSPTVKMTSISPDRYFKITLTLNFTHHHSSSDELEIEDRSWFQETKEDFEARVKDYEATDAHFNSYEKIVAHVKSNDPFEFIESIPEHEIISAEWDPKDFKISFIIRVDDPAETVENIRSWIEMQSLEDGEYEACCDNGWTVKTLGETMEYGLTDYRDNPILIELVESPDMKPQGAKLIAVLA